MTSFMNPDNILQFAFVNFDTLKDRKIRGVVVDCHGYSDIAVWKQSDDTAAFLGENGVLFVHPYYPYDCWGNDGCIAFIDDILRALYTGLNLDADRVPLVMTGGSMGGMTALIYTLDGHYKPCAAAMNCPVTDMNRYFHTEHEYNTIYTAYCQRGFDLQKEIDRHSPILRTADLPDIPYYIVGGERDKCVTVNEYIRPFAEKLRAEKSEVMCDVVADMGHCQINDFPEAAKKWRETLLGWVDRFQK